MKKFFTLLFVPFVLSLPITSHAFENNVKVNLGLPRMTSFEYERNLNNVLPNLSAFINYGTGELDLSSEKTKINGLGIGARYKIPFLGYIGLGYASLNVDYSYLQTIASGGISAGSSVDVSGTMSGFLIEYGKSFHLGPVILGGSLGYIMGSPSVSGKVGNQKVNSKDINAGLATIDGMPQFGFYVGFAF